MKKVVGHILTVLFIFLFSGCEFPVEKGIEIIGSFEGTFGGSKYYVLYKEGNENDPFYFYMDADSTVYDIQGKISLDSIRTILNSYNQYSLKISYDETLTKEIPACTIGVEDGSLAYYALKVEQYLDVPEGYAVCEFQNIDTIMGREVITRKVYEIGKPWTFEAFDLLENKSFVHSFHVSSLYLDINKKMRATEDTFKSFPAEGITLYVEKTLDITGHYVSEKDGSLLNVDDRLFTFINATEEITYPYKNEYYLGSYYSLVNENDEVAATFNFTFTNLDNYLYLRFEGESQEVTYKKQS